MSNESSMNNTTSESRIASLEEYCKQLEVMIKDLVKRIATLEEWKKKNTYPDNKGNLPRF